MHLRTSTIVTTLVLVSMSFAELTPNDLLAGPSIEQDEVTNEDMISRKLQETGKQNNLNPNLQHKLWMSALESVNLTNEQKTKLGVIQKELKAEQQEFRKTYGKDIATLRKDRKDKNSGGKLSSDSRKKMMEMMSFAPDVKVYQEKAWVLLSEEQHKTFQTTYQTLLEEEAKRREQNKDKVKPEEKDKKAPGFGIEDSMVDSPSERLRGGNFNRHNDSVDEASFRRIEFLRKLQELSKD
ncbi:MAG: hypothetical protein H8E86_02260 [Planctomycetes bacterium]|nr:hypothetical protein [Planctomycetota bacterium]